jgi:hypothetical protein
MAVRSIGFLPAVILFVFAHAVPQKPPLPAPAMVAAAPAQASGSDAKAPASPSACAAGFGVYGPIKYGPPVTTLEKATADVATAAPVQTVSVTTNAGGAKAGGNGKGKPPAKPPAKLTTAPTTRTTFLQLEPGLNAADVAATLRNRIPGITEMVAIGPSSLLYTIDPSKAAELPAAEVPAPVTTAAKTVKAKPTAQTPMEAIQAELDRLLKTFPRVAMSEPEVLDLPAGYNGACSIITIIGRQIPAVLSLAAISDTRVLATFSGPKAADVAAQKATLQKLIDRLAITSAAIAPKVRSVAVRLYYDRDAGSVATVVGNAFSQLKVSSVSMSPANPYRDSIVIADPSGSASAETLEQAQRMVTELDEPRAQVIVNAWSLQVSSNQPNGAAAVVPQARRLAAGYNDALESAVMRGWNFVNRTATVAEGASSNPIDYDGLFSSYLCKVSTFHESGSAEAAGGSSWTTAALPQSTTGGPSPFHPVELPYALGYSSLCQSEAPDLVQMLILVMAAKNPGAVSEATLDAMEGRQQSPEPAQAAESCQQVDQAFYVDQNQFAHQKDRAGFVKNAARQEAPKHVAFACTREILQGLTRSSSGHEVYTTSAVGQFRAAVVDFLFQNKMKSEYPDEFDPFLYPSSAATLDAALTPIVDAFDQDLEMLQQNLQDQLTVNVPQDRHLHYSSNGLVSVKVVSGNEAAVRTQSLNYFPQNPVISLESFAKAIASGQAASGTTIPPVPLLAGSLSSVAATIGAYAASQPQQVTAKVGSGLAMTVTPFTLSSAKGAELNVDVKYNENGAATLSSDATKSNATDDLNSRVSAHEVSTLVRMDSLKFLEISTMQSVIARQRSPWKPIDPLFELPLLDNPGIVIYRRKPEMIYDQSIIFLEASIMPTAADLGQGLIYESDDVATTSGSGAAQIFAAHSSHDFGDWGGSEADAITAIKKYHKRMVAYFAGEYIDADGTVHAPAFASLPDNLSKK